MVCDKYLFLPGSRWLACEKYVFLPGSHGLAWEKYACLLGPAAKALKMWTWRLHGSFSDLGDATFGSLFDRSWAGYASFSNALPLPLPDKTRGDKCFFDYFCFAPLRSNQPTNLGQENFPKREQRQPLIDRMSSGRSSLRRKLVQLIFNTRGRSLNWSVKIIED